MVNLYLIALNFSTQIFMIVANDQNPHYTATHNAPILSKNYSNALV